METLAELTAVTPSVMRHSMVLPAAFGRDSGTIGAAALALEGEQMGI